MKPDHHHERKQHERVDLSALQVSDQRVKGEGEHRHANCGASPQTPDRRKRHGPAGAGLLVARGRELRDDEHVMGPRFTPCSSCARHVKQGDVTCPFCGEHVPRVNVAVVRAAAGRLSRSALVAASAVGVVLATTDCGGSKVAEPMGDAAESEDAADGSSTNPGDAAGETGITDGGSNQPSNDAARPRCVTLYGCPPI